LSPSINRVSVLGGWSTNICGHHIRPVVVNSCGISIFSGFDAVLNSWFGS
jgi:hypothetical protein